MKCVFRVLLVVFFSVTSLYLVYCLVSRTLEINSNREPLKKTPSKYILQETATFPQSGGNVRFNQKWPLPDRKVLKTREDLYELGEYVLLGNFSYSKGLGNLMFQYAALVGLAQEYKAILPLSETNLLRRAFDLNAILITDELHEDLLKAAEGPVLTDCCSYKELNLDFSPINNLKKVEGYMQNWRWFYPGPTAKQVLNEFQFLPEVQQMATDIIEDAKLKWRLGRADVVHRENEEIDYRLQFGDEKIDPITIGVHVRRGLDLIQNQRNLNHGHVAAPNNYYEAAIKHFRDTFPNVVFLVSSDDVQWAKANLLVEQAGELYFLPKSTDREVGMAVMSGCDHLIISTGTFSWWAAYLADNERNEIIYYKDWPREGSELAKMINKSEFFLPRWMPM